MFYDQVNPNPIPEVAPFNPGREFTEPGAPTINPPSPDREFTDPPEPHIDEPIPSREIDVPAPPPEYQPSTSTAMISNGFSAQGPNDEDNENINHATMPPGPEQDIEVERDASTEDAGDDEEPVNFNFPDPSTGNGQF